MRNLILTLLLLCTSCIQIGSAPSPMNYYLLESMTEAPKTYSGINLHIHLELINFPEYLDRVQIVTHNGDNDITFSDSERWAESLQDNIMRVIRENLSLLIPGSVISAGSWESSSNKAVKTGLVFNRFSGKINDHTQIDIRWKFPIDGKQTIQGHFTEKQPIGANYQDLVIGLNNGINNFSLELAEEMVKMLSTSH